MQAGPLNPVLAGRQLEYSACSVLRPLLANQSPEHVAAVVYLMARRLGITAKEGKLALAKHKRKLDGM